MTRDEEYITINSNSHTSSEVHLMRSSKMLEVPVLVKSRQPMLSYHMEHAHGRFYILANKGHYSDLELIVSDCYKPASWEPFHKEATRGLVVHDLEVHSDLLLLYCTRDTRPVAVVIDPTGSQDPYLLEGEEDLCWIEKPPSTLRFDADKIPIIFSSPHLRPCIFISDGKSSMRLDQLDPSPSLKCTVKRMCAVSDVGGVDVPVTLCYHGNQVDVTSPLLVHVYGCYGENLPLSYRPHYQLLLSLGWCLAFCHVRGGGERGRSWYHAGQGRNKMNSITDLHTCLHYLHHHLHISHPSLTAMTGRSAGGQTVAMFCNLWPEMIQAVILQVPFVNVLGALMDTSWQHCVNLLDYGEYDILTSSAETKGFLESVCPLSNLTPQGYPSFYIAASRQDNIVLFKDVKQYSQKLNQCLSTFLCAEKLRWKATMNCSGNRQGLLPRGTVVFRELCGRGHFESDDTRKKSSEAALEILFLHKALGLSMTKEVS